MKTQARTTAGFLVAATLAATLTLTACDLTLSRVENSPPPVPSAGAPTHSASATPTPSDIKTGDNDGQTPGPVADKWKVFTDPGKTISFELPVDWVAQVIPGQRKGALDVEVNLPDGKRVAVLNTQIQGLGGACQPESARPYTVLASIPMDIPSNNKSSGAVEPRFVYRLIQGDTHFYASYGITDHSAGTDGTACLVYNTVTSKPLGIYMFGDVLQFTSDPSGSPGLRAFTTITDAQDYMLSSEYQNIAKMITSLKSLG